jgi:hypothetical protein
VVVALTSALASATRDSYYTQAQAPHHRYRREFVSVLARLLRS